ncbi:MAG: hypothetical protein AVDCRST_MAG49-3223, partial [uncultured Thermomicrobiales bacterium]
AQERPDQPGSGGDRRPPGRRRPRGQLHTGDDRGRDCRRPKGRADRLRDLRAATAASAPRRGPTDGRRDHGTGHGDAGVHRQCHLQGADQRGVGAI